MKLVEKMFLSVTLTFIVFCAYSQTNINNPSVPVGKVNSPQALSVVKDLTAKSMADKIVINWTATNETNTNYFTIERSSDLVNFESINRVYANVKKAATAPYELIDYAPYKGVSHYRLKLTDFQDKVTYSEIVTVTLTSSASLDIIRNATSGSYIIDFKTIAEKEENYTVEITNGLGEKVYEEKLANFIGRYSKEIDLAAYGKTAYVVTISSNSDKTVKRVVVY